MKKVNEIEEGIKIRPIRDRILVRIKNDPDVTAGGIFVPDFAKDLPQEGEVVAVGSGIVSNGEVRPFDVKVGDKVYFHKHSGIHFWQGKQELLFLKESEILLQAGGSTCEQPAKATSVG